MSDRVWMTRSVASLNNGPNVWVWGLGFRVEGLEMKGSSDGVGVAKPS